MLEKEILTKVNKNAMGIRKNAEAIEKNREAIEQNRVAIEECKMGIRKNAEAIEKNRVAIEQNTKDIKEIKEELKNHGRALLIIEDAVTNKIPALFDKFSVHDDRFDRDEERIGKVEMTTEHHTNQIAALELTTASIQKNFKN